MKPSHTGRTKWFDADQGFGVIVADGWPGRGLGRFFGHRHARLPGAQRRPTGRVSLRDAAGRPGRIRASSDMGPPSRDSYLMFTSQRLALASR